MKKVLTFEDFINESEVFQHKQTVYKVDLIKADSYGEAPAYHLVLTDKATNNIFAWREVFTYTTGYSQGTNRSGMEYFLQTKFYGGAGNGSGRSKPEKPRFISRELEYIVDAWQGDHYNKDATEWFQENVNEFPPKTKLSDIKRSLS